MVTSVRGRGADSPSAAFVRVMNQLPKDNLVMGLEDRQLLARLFEALPEPILCVDRALIIRYANPAAARILRKPSVAALIGSSLDALGSPLSSCLMELCTDALVSGQARPCAEVAVPVAGSSAYFDMDAQPVRDDTGMVLAVVVVLHDATERVLLREAQQTADEKARLLARALQSNILLEESAGSLPGYQHAFAYHPMDREHELGGDFFDIFRLGPNTFGFAVGDVCGKGIEAVLDTAVVKFFLKALARDARQPADVLAKAHRAAREEPQFQNFATVFYALLDTEAHTLTWANAGHEPPLLLRADGLVEALQPSGVPLGLSVVTSPGYEQRIARLHPGDVLLVYSDGVTEARNVDGAVWGRERLEALVVACRDAPPQESVTRIEQEIAAFTGGRQTDDRILIALKRE